MLLFCCSYSDVNAFLFFAKLTMVVVCVAYSDSYIVYFVAREKQVWQRNESIFLRKI